MSPHVHELLDLVIRWTHLIAGIMWIGNSMLFNWLDRNLERPPDAAPGFEGRIWMVHSGGFYDVVKKQLEPSQLPKTLHWFKWQNFSTWASGIFLLLVVYYLGDSALLVDAGAGLGRGAAIGIGLGAVLGGWAVYDALWRSPLGKRPQLASALSLLLLLGLIYTLTHTLSGRAAYIHVGVVLGTIMTGNVWMVILPSQRELVAATAAGREQDPALGKRAKQRSIHNNYMTFPLLFIMISNHFPSTYGGRSGWVVLVVLMLGGALVRHFMNIRFHYPGWLTAATVTVVLTLGGLYVLTRPQRLSTAGEQGSFSSAHAVIKRRCTACHSSMPTDEVWRVAPANVMFDTPAQIKAMAARIRARAVDNKTMPLGNKTGMTDEERAVLGAWLERGARID
ncbi:MAG: urate hydroxylase PuuD [Polyangia bacterium]